MRKIPTRPTSPRLVKFRTPNNKKSILGAVCARLLKNSRRNVRYWHLADNSSAPVFVRYWSNSGHWFGAGSCGFPATTPLSIVYAYQSSS